MALYTKHDLMSDKTRAYYEQNGDSYALAQIAAGTFNPETDIMCADGKSFIRHDAQYDGRILRVFADSTYLGDGDRVYHAAAIVANEDGTTFRAGCGEGGGWYESGVKFHGSEADASDELRAKVEARKVADKLAKEAAKADEEAREPRKGRYCIVVKGRKNKGAHGDILWAGLGKFGYAVRMKDSKTGKEDFYSYDNIEVIPDWEDAWAEGGPVAEPTPKVAEPTPVYGPTNTDSKAFRAAAALVAEMRADDKAQKSILTTKECGIISAVVNDLTALADGTSGVPDRKRAELLVAANIQTLMDLYHELRGEVALS